MPSLRLHLAFFALFFLLVGFTACSASSQTGTPTGALMEPILRTETATRVDVEPSSTFIPSTTSSPSPPPTPAATSTLEPTASPAPKQTTTASAANLSFSIVKEYPHDPDAFTQGLVIHENQLYESTGLRGQSSVRKVDLETGRVQEIRHLPDAYFGEGFAIVGDRIILITWQSGTGFVYDLDTFEVVDTFTYPHEGWGLTYDGSVLYMSDGTAVIHLLDPDDYTEIATLEVRDGDTPVTMINELEFIRGSIYANIWQTTRIAVIDPKTGSVTAWIDLEALRDYVKTISGEIDVLNGIAYNSETDQVFVTGKLWPKLFEIEIIYPE